MPNDLYGTTQVREIRFSQREIDAIILDNIKHRNLTPYDFDYDHPLVLHSEGEVIFRFVLRETTKERSPRSLQWSSLEEMKAVKDAKGK